MNPLSISMKQCTGRCQQLLPATTEYFYPKSKTSIELRARCKQCSKIIPENTLPTRQCPTCEKEHPNTEEFFYPYKKQCKECCSKKGKEYMATHKEQHREFMHNYNIIHRNERLEHQKIYETQHPEIAERRARNYRIKHREEINARARTERLAHPERHRERSLAYRLRHPERVREQARRTSHKHRERVNVNRRTYYARKKHATGTHTVQDIQTQYDRQDSKCYWCGKKLGKAKHEYHVDHVIPLVRGGSNNPDNLVIACPHCNQSKHDKLPHEWFQGGRLL